MIPNLPYSLDRTSFFHCSLPPPLFCTMHNRVLVTILAQSMLLHINTACPMSQYAEWVVVTDNRSLILRDGLDGTATKNLLSTEAGRSKNTNFTWIPLNQIIENHDDALYVTDENDSTDEYEFEEEVDDSFWPRIRQLSLLLYKWAQIALAFLSTVFASYEDALVQHPAVTKSITAAVVSFTGDLVAQAVEKTRKRFDLYRSFSLAAEGLFISGPLLHFAYDSFENCVTSWKIGNVWLESAVQLAMDIIVLDSFFTGTLMVTSAVLQGHDVFKELKHDYIPAVYVAWLSSFSMAPLQLMNFGVVPLRYRVLVTNFQDVIWNAAVSTMAHRSRQ